MTEFDEIEQTADNTQHDARWPMAANTILIIIAVHNGGPSWAYLATFWRQLGLESGSCLAQRLPKATISRQPANSVVPKLPVVAVPIRARTEATLKR